MELETIVKPSQRSQEHRLDGTYTHSPCGHQKGSMSPPRVTVFSSITVILVPTMSFADDSGAVVACRMGSVDSTNGIAVALS